METNSLFIKLDEISDLTKKYENDVEVVSDKKRQILKIDKTIKQLESAVDKYLNYRAEPDYIDKKELNAKHGVVYFYFKGLSISVFIFSTIIYIMHLCGYEFFSDTLNLAFFIVCICILLISPIPFLPYLEKDSSKQRILKKLHAKSNKFKEEHKCEYQQCLIEIEDLKMKKHLLEDLLGVLSMNIPNYEERLNQYTYFIPRKYMTSQAIDCFKEYLQYGRAFTIGECINIYENEKQHEEIITLEKEKRYKEEKRHEELLRQQQEDACKQEELNKKVVIQNENMIKQNKEKIKIEKQRLSEEEAIRRELEKRNLPK